MTADEWREQEYDGQWIEADMECVICNASWTAVYPEIAPALECPDCGYMNSKPESSDERRL